jgi:hypothetical protein
MIDTAIRLDRDRDTIATGTCTGERVQPIKNSKECKILVTLRAPRRPTVSSAPTGIPVRRTVRCSAERGLGQWRETRGHLGYPVRDFQLGLIPDRSSSYQGISLM